MERKTLRDAREWRGLTQEELEKLADVGQSAISLIERGIVTNPSNSTVERLELALRLKRGTLIFGVPEAAKAS